MKTILLATAAAALFAAPAFAQDAVGSVGVTYSNPSIEVAGNDVDADVWTVDGTVALPAADWTVTLNGAVDYTKAFGEEDFTGVAAAHLTKMWTSDVRAGAVTAPSVVHTTPLGCGASEPPVATTAALDSVAPILTLRCAAGLPRPDCSLDCPRARQPLMRQPFVDVSERRARGRGRADGQHCF